MTHTHEEHVTIFIRKVKDLAYRSQQDAVLVAIGFVYVMLKDVLIELARSFGGAKAGLQNIYKQETDPQ